MNTNEQNSKQPEESLSFQDITAELGDIKISPVQDGTPGSEPALPEASYPPGGTMIVDDTSVPPSPEEAMSTAALTGSSPKPRPMWVDGLVCDVLAALFILPIVLNIGLRGYQPWISYSAMFLALGAAVWSLFGLQVETEPTGRKMCFISAGAGVIIAIVAFLVRAPLH